MKNYIFLLLILLGIAASSCKESELTTLSQADAIYFQLQETNFDHAYTYWDDWLKYKGDSISFSFGAIPEEHPSYRTEDTVWVQVNVLGRIESRNRSFEVSVSDLSTAEEGVHFQTLEGSYTFPAGDWYTSFPVIVYNHESLGETPYTLHLVLKESDDFNLGLEGRTNARLHIYNNLVQPLIWDQYIAKYLGTYSKAKHKVILLTNGGVLLPNTKEEYDDMGGYRTISDMRIPMNTYLKENEVYDENGIRVEPVE